MGACCVFGEYRYAGGRPLPEGGMCYLLGEKESEIRAMATTLAAHRYRPTFKALLYDPHAGMFLTFLNREAARRNVTLPGGGMKTHESPIEALWREFHEEIAGTVLAESDIARGLLLSFALVPTSRVNWVKKAVWVVGLPFSGLETLEPVPGEGLRDPFLHHSRDSVCEHIARSHSRAEIKKLYTHAIASI